MYCGKIFAAFGQLVEKLSGSAITGITLFISGCCGATGQVAQNNPQANPQSQPQAAPQNQASGSNVENAQVGTTYTVNYYNSKYEVTLKEAEFASSTNMYAQGTYLMANFEIKNIGDGNEMFAPDIYALDKDGEKYDKTFAVGLDEKYSKTLDFFKKLSPNTKMSGWAAIEVPDGTSSVDLYFEYTNQFLTKTPSYIKYKISK